MKYSAFLSLFAAQNALARNILHNRDTCKTNDLHLPEKGLKLLNGVAFGWLPDSGAGTTIAQINKDVGNKSSTYGWYSQITSSSSYDGSQLLEVMADVVGSGAVFIPAVMPTGLTFSQVTPAIATDIANVVKKFTSQGVEVWLRFAHEMNYYASPNVNTYHGTAAEFIQAWKNVHDAVKGIDGCLMFWSPNIDSPANIQPWYPGDDYVDIIGVDDYPAAGTSFDDAYGPFYQAFVVSSNKHFCIGETGSKSAAVSDKEAWLHQLATASTSKYPCFQSVSWFEYDKGGQDFRIIEGQSAATVKKTLSQFE